MLFLCFVSAGQISGDFAPIFTTVSLVSIDVLRPEANQRAKYGPALRFLTGACTLKTDLKVS